LRRRIRGYIGVMDYFLGWNYGVVKRVSKELFMPEQRSVGAGDWNWKYITIQIVEMERIGSRSQHRYIAILAGGGSIMASTEANDSRIDKN
jgi:hypothetical protein